MQLIKKIEIPDPPTKYKIKYKRPKLKTVNGKQKLVTERVFYLTANLFYAHKLDYAHQKRIINFCKTWLELHLQGLPKLQKMNLHITYRSPRENWDLDNKGYFWRKLILDVMKTPTDKQVARKKMQGRNIVTTRTIPDDDVRHVNYCTERYEKGPEALVIEIHGVVVPKQKKLIY